MLERVVVIFFLFKKEFREPSFSQTLFGNLFFIVMWVYHHVAAIFLCKKKKKEDILITIFLSIWQLFLYQHVAGI